MIKSIKTNAFTQQVLTHERRNYTHGIRILETQKRELDSIFTSLQNNSAVAYARDYINLADLLKLKIELEKEKIALENKLNQLQSITVIHDFPQYITPSNKHPELIAVTALAISVFLCIATLVIPELQP